MTFSQSFSGRVVASQNVRIEIFDRIVGDEPQFRERLYHPLKHKGHQRRNLNILSFLVFLENILKEETIHCEWRQKYIVDSF